MKDQIRMLRKHLDITQQEFADRLRIKRGAIANYEVGRNIPTDSVVSLICREFNVNEEWLRTGKGEMFKPRPSDVLDQLAYKYKLSNADYVMIEQFVNLRPEARQIIFKHWNNIFAALSEMDPFAPAYAGTEPPQSMDKLMETFKNQPKEDAAPEMSVEEAKAAYLKSISNSARNKKSITLNTTDDMGQSAPSTAKALTPEELEEIKAFQASLPSSAEEFEKMFPPVTLYDENKRLG